ncbi:MAG: hypothetical protein FWF76_04985 [Oscillospiraceae bacterium]|nr:hypothetical protein [Oscillospiraceae bacterium]
MKLRKRLVATVMAGVMAVSMLGFTSSSDIPTEDFAEVEISPFNLSWTARAQLHPTSGHVPTAASIPASQSGFNTGRRTETVTIIDRFAYVEFNVYSTTTRAIRASVVVWNGSNWVNSTWNGTNNASTIVLARTPGATVSIGARTAPFSGQHHFSHRLRLEPSLTTALNSPTATNGGHASGRIR